MLSPVFRRKQSEAQGNVPPSRPHAWSPEAGCKPAHHQLPEAWMQPKHLPSHCPGPLPLWEPLFPLLPGGMALCPFLHILNISDPAPPSPRASAGLRAGGRWGLSPHSALGTVLLLDFLKADLTHKRFRIEGGIFQPSTQLETLEY